mmetsp:Transcript_93061/g.170773  ORF Transcript_93061/g.170773 Transcript_93061/m.170773 type:complete len:645 (+) Transcript_93061:63-1997(+)
MVVLSGTATPPAAGAMRVQRRLARHCHILVVLLLPAVGASSPPCHDEASCETHMSGLIERLTMAQEKMKSKRNSMEAIEDLREGIMKGGRVQMPTTHRQHLERVSPLVGAVTIDQKHRPVTTNNSKHLRFVRSFATDMEVEYHSIMPLKKQASQKSGPSALIATISTAKRLSLFTLDGEVRLSDFDLGHAPGNALTNFMVSQSAEKSYVLTVDESGELRQHDLKVEVKAEKSGEESEDGEEVEKKPKEKTKKQLQIQANLTLHFTFPPTWNGESRKINAVLPVERGTQPFIVAGDSLGGVSVFYKNGTLKGRVKVTEDPGGVRGLLRGQAQTVLFYSSHSFGFVSVSQVDVTTPPCTGWNSPLFDIAPDPSSSYNRVLLALSDGDVLVFSTQSGKSKACDLTLKFPHISALPYKLYTVKGHVMGMPTLPEGLPRPEDYFRELHFFNLASMEGGYGTAPSRAVTLQASFRPRQPEAFAVLGSSGGGSGGSTAKGVHLVLRFTDKRGVELYELNLRQSSSASSGGSGSGGASGGSGGNGGSGGGTDFSSWFNWVPKIGVFGIALIGVVIWNVRKVTSQQQSDRLHDFDDDYLKEQLKKRAAAKKDKDKDGGDLGGLGSLGKKDSGAGDRSGIDLDDLAGPGSHDED